MKYFRTSAGEFTVGQAVEVMVSIDPVELRRGHVVELNRYDVFVEFDDGTFPGWYRPCEVRG